MRDNRRTLKLKRNITVHLQRQIIYYLFNFFPPGVFVGKYSAVGGNGRYREQKRGGIFYPEGKKELEHNNSYGK